MKYKFIHYKQLDNIIDSKINKGFRLPKSGKHMKGTTCFGLLLLFFIMLGLSLNVSSDVSAYTFSIDSFLAYPFEFPTSPDNSANSSGITYRFTSSDHVPTNLRTGSYMRASYDSSTQKCRYGQVSQPGYTVSGATITWGGSFIPPFALDGLSNLQKCHTMVAFGTDSIPPFDEGTVPFDKKITVGSYLPYSYMYNTIPFNHVRTVDGVDYPSSFDVSELLNNPADPGDSDFVYYTDVLNSVTFPLNWNNSDRLEAGSSLQFAGSIIFGQGLSDSEVSNLRMDFLSSKFYSGGSESAFTGSADCNLTSQNEDNTRINFLCVGHLNNVTYRYMDLRIRLYTYDNSAFSSRKQSLSFSDDFLTTNDNPTPLDVRNGSIGANGSFPNVAPGVASVDSSNADWFSSLISLFSFNLINPFAPIFNLFTNNDSCAYIPTIASMIHSNETTVCPWFDSTTRNILTPVLGLSSMMLVFGFAVRWLGARSGNFIEDSGGHDAGGLHLENKYRRKK